LACCDRFSINLSIEPVADLWEDRGTRHDGLVHLYFDAIYAGEPLECNAGERSGGRGRIAATSPIGSDPVADREAVGGV
jgi:hypothetical protein